MTTTATPNRDSQNELDQLSGGRSRIMINAYYFSIWSRSKAEVSVFDTWQLWFRHAPNIGYHAIELTFALLLYRRPKSIRIVVGLQAAILGVLTVVQSNFDAWRWYKTKGLFPWESMTTDGVIAAFANMIVSVIPFLAVFVFISTGARCAYLESTGNAYCERCGYDLTGNESGVCPECGRRVESVSESGLRSDKSVDVGSSEASSGADESGHGS